MLGLLLITTQVKVTALVLTYRLVTWQTNVIQDGGYIQATYVIPTGTKLGVAYGVSRLDLASGETAVLLVEENNRWTVGAYHPLTKHLNLVAEYNAD